MEDIGNIKETQTQKMLREALEKAQAEYRLSFRFHDLQKIKRNGDYYLVSSDVNKAENYKKIYLWTYKSCGCCQDAVIYAIPYIIVDDINIYAQADGCAIGEVALASMVLCHTNLVLRSMRSTVSLER